MRLLFAVLLCAAGTSAQTAVEGLWVGTLDVQVMKLRLAMHLDGNGRGKLDSIDQGANGIPIDSVKLTGARVSIAVNAVNGTYEGELLDGGARIQGIWKQGGSSLPLVLTRSNAMPELRRPQNPKPPFSYKQEDVTFASRGETSDGKPVTLAGTLTLPQGSGPFAAVVMITGSGPQDRDETLLGHKPFWIIADHLARHGIAVLRVDDRGVGKSTGNFGQATSADFADDAEGGVRYLRSRKDIAGIGLAGHSEGGMIAPMVANRSPDVGFVILMAGTSVPAAAVLLEQQKLISRAMGLPESFIEKNAEREKTLIDIARQEPDPKAALEKMRATIPDTPELKPVMDQQFAMANTAWFRWFINYDPGPALKQLKQPVLILSGALDLQVSPAQNLPVFAQDLEAGGNKDYEIVKFAGLNHLFQHAHTGAPGEYSTIDETISPQVLDVITGWITRHK